MRTSVRSLMPAVLLLGAAACLLTSPVRAQVSLTALGTPATVPSVPSDPSPGDESARADLRVTKVDTPDPVTAGTNLTYTITVTNDGPSTAVSASLIDNLPAETTFVSISSPGGWSCSTPAVGEGGGVSCSAASLAPGSEVFTLVVAVSPATSDGSEITNLAVAVSETLDPEPENEIGVATTTVAASADLSVIKTDSSDPAAAGLPLAYTLTVANAGPSNAAAATWSDPLPAGTTFLSLSAPGGWTCSTPAVGATGTVSCSHPSFPAGSADFTLTVNVDAGVANGTVITNTATVTSSTADPSPGNETATASTTVANGATVSATKTARGQLYPRGTVTYTVTLTNSSVHAQADNPGDEFSDVLPAQLTLVSATASSGTAVATLATNTVTWNGSIAGNSSVTITIQATVEPDVPQGTTITNQGTVFFDSDGDGTNDDTVTTDDPAAGGSADPTVFVVAQAPFSPEIPTLNEAGLALVVLLLALGGAGLLRRRSSKDLA